MSQDAWLDKVDADPSIIPWALNEWDILQGEFVKSFIDYAEHERADAELRQLKMTENNVDKYISEFKQLAFRSNQDPNAPSILKMFVSGLPKALAHSCLDNDDP